MTDDPRTPPDRPSRGGFSMALLDEIVRDALEPGYAAAARRRAEDGPGPRRRGLLRLAAVLVLLAIGFGFALAVGDVRRNAPDAAAARNDLVDRVQDRTSSTDTLAADVSALRSQVDAARDAALDSTRAGRIRAEALEQLASVTGALPVTGPGVRVTLDDAPPRPQDAGSTEADLGRVQDRDIQLVVNGLWAAGAEAVAVDGYRITARTAIRSAGEAILVDFRPVTAPYVIEAIGEPDELEARFTEGPGGRALATLGATYGIRFSTESVARLNLPAAVSLGDAAEPAPGGTP